MKYLNKFVEIITSLAYFIVMPMVMIAKRHPIAFGFALIIHIVIIVGLFYTNVARWEIPDQQASASTQQSVTIKAVIKDLDVIKAEKQRLVKLDQQKENKRIATEKKAKEIEERRIAAEKKTKKATEKRIAEEKKTKEAKEQTKLADKERKIIEAEAAEAYRKKVQAEKEEKAKTKEEEAKAKKAKETRIAEEKKTKEEEAKAKKAKEMRIAEDKRITEAKEAEDKRITEAKEAEDKRITEAKEAEDKRIAKQNLTTEIRAEELQEIELAVEDQTNKLKSGYIASIAKRVKEEWRYNAAEDDWGCDVYITQDKDGEVLSVNVQRCNVDDSKQASSFRNSIERAVYKASKLPIAPDKSVFDTQILFYFRVN